MFKGIFCPSITITNKDGSIDYENWAKHLNHLADAGINGVLLFGSIGEFYAVPTETKKEVLKFAKDLVGNRMKIFFGISDVKLNTVLESAKFGEENGADALVCISPYYFGPSNITAKKYFDTVASSVNCPIILYNFPDRSGNDLSPELIHEIVKDNKNICGVKDTVDTISHTRKIIQKLRKENPEFCVLSGFDEYYFVNRISGGNGVLSGLTNIEPETFVKMHKYFESKEYETALECAKRISHLMKIYDVCDLFISSIKAGVFAKGLNISTDIFEPATQANEKHIEVIKEILNSK